MKRVLLFLGTIALVSVITMHLQAQYQQEKQATLILSRGELEAIYQIIDESATPGSVRKPLLDKIMRAYQATFPQTTQGSPTQQKKDTSKPKK